jgi:hypothetical protein
MLPSEMASQPNVPASLLNGWRRAVEWTVVGLTFTGAAWLMARYVFAIETEFGPLPAPWAARVLALHGGLAMLSLLAFGAWLSMHVVPNLRQRSGLRTGVAQLSLLAALTVTGYGLYYLSDESSRPAWSTVHWLCGLVLPVSLLIHRRRRRLSR